MTKGNRNSQSIHAIPGPGQYKSDFKSMFKTAPRNVFGSSSRDKNSFYDGYNRMQPGPGAYNQSHYTGKEGTAQTITPRRPDTAPRTGVFSPGPGAYENMDHATAKSPPKTRIGTSHRRDLTMNSGAPAPNAYNVDNPSKIRSLK
jgi:hypothetical protein